MKFDTIIIGGGLTGLSCALSLQKRGLKCAVISAGQSALHFSSGSLDLLNFLPDGTQVKNPVEAVSSLPENHPYRKLGEEFESYAHRAKSMLTDCGISVCGKAVENHFRYTPMGSLRPTWLTFSEFVTMDSEDGKISGKVLVTNFEGFLDFNTKFIADSLSGQGADCKISLLNVPAVDKLRMSPTEMRASNIARTFENDENLRELVDVLKKVSAGYDKVVLPAVFGLRTENIFTRLSNEIPATVVLMPTMPPSVPGIRTQMALRRVFERLGGTYILGDTVQAAVVEGNSVKRIYTANHVDFPFEADNYVLATGHFFSGGLVSDMDSVREPVFGCDVEYIADRGRWYEKDPFAAHEYLKFGVVSDHDFRLRKSGVCYDNLYGAGSVLAGADSRTEGSGAGVSMLTALRVADLIAAKDERVKLNK